MYNGFLRKILTGIDDCTTYLWSVHHKVVAKPTRSPLVLRQLELTRLTITKMELDRLI